MTTGWKTRYSAQTTYTYTIQMRAFLRTLAGEGAAQHLEKLRAPRPRAIVPTNDELRRLKTSAQPFMRAWLILAAELGLRISETLRVCDATHNAQTRSITIITKGAKPRTLPTTQELESLFGIAPSATDPTTPLIARLHGRPISASQLRRYWSKLKKQTGTREEIHPHDLRRSAAERLYDQTRDIRAVQRMLGHDDLTSTMQYLEHYDPENLRPLIDSLRIPTEAKQ